MGRKILAITGADGFGHRTAFIWGGTASVRAARWCRLVDQSVVLGSGSFQFG